jgi:hypothetical protein
VGCIRGYGKNIAKSAWDNVLSMLQKLDGCLNIDLRRSIDGNDAEGFRRERQPFDNPSDAVHMPYLSLLRRSLREAKACRNVLKGWDVYIWIAFLPS